VAHPSRLAVKNGEHLRMTAAIVWWQMLNLVRSSPAVTVVVVLSGKSSS
jgi:hypothetical protein